MQDETEMRDAGYPGRMVALVDGSGTGDAIAAALLDDFSSALIAYAWMSGAQKPRIVRDEALEAPHAHEAHPYDSCGPEQRGQSYAADLAETSELVVALSADGNVEERLARALSVPDGRTPQSARCHEAGSTPPLVYVIAYTEGGADASAAARLDALGTVCQAHGARWGGGVLLGEADLYPKLFRSPRMGAYRRPLSQAIDRLVAAVRLGETMQEAARITGRKDIEDVVVATPGLLPLARILFVARA